MRLTCLAIIWMAAIGIQPNVGAADNAGIGYVNQTDVDLIRNALAEQANLDPGIALRCNVNGLLNHVEQGGLPTDCEISDAMAILRVLDGLDMAGDNLQQCVAP